MAQRYRAPLDSLDTHITIGKSGNLIMLAAPVVKFPENRSPDGVIRGQGYVAVLPIVKTGSTYRAAASGEVQAFKVPISSSARGYPMADDYKYDLSKRVPFKTVPFKAGRTKLTHRLIGDLVSPINRVINGIRFGNSKVTLTGDLGDYDGWWVDLKEHPQEL